MKEKKEILKSKEEPKEDMRKYNGGAREGAGRHEIDANEKKRSYNVYLKERQKNYLEKKHKSLTKAMTTLLPEALK